MSLCPTGRTLLWLLILQFIFPIPQAHIGRITQHPLCFTMLTDDGYCYLTYYWMDIWVVCSLEVFHSTLWGLSFRLFVFNVHLFERQWRRWEIFHLLLYFLNACHSWCWDRLKSSSHVDGREANNFSHHLMPLRVDLSKKLQSGAKLGLPETPHSPTGSGQAL